MIDRRAKERRERLRYAQPAPDYVPLGTGVSLTPASAAAGTHEGGQAAGQSSGSDEDEEDDPRLRLSFLGGSSRSKQQRQQQQQPVFAAGQLRNEVDMCRCCLSMLMVQLQWCALTSHH